MTECYISVDIETSGPIVGEHSMLALGACIVDEPDIQFSALLKPISEAVVPEAMNVVGHDLSFFATRGQEQFEAIESFRKWVVKSSCGRRPVFVAFNSPFDWSFVNWYLLTFGGENPFGVSALDIKAFYAGMTGVDWADTRSSKLPDEFRSTREHSHNALDDAIEQAEIFSKMRARVKAMKAGDSERRRQDIIKREKAANQQATQHAVLRDFYGNWSIALTVAALLLTALLVALSLASDETMRQAFGLSPIAFKLTSATIALVAFSLVLIQLVWRPDSRQFSHSAAVKHYTNAKFEFRQLLKQGEISTIDVTISEAKYLDVRDLPSIPERWFLGTKKWHQNKLAESRRLDENGIGKGSADVGAPGKIEGEP